MTKTDDTDETLVLGGTGTILALLLWGVDLLNRAE